MLSSTSLWRKRGRCKHRLRRSVHSFIKDQRALNIWVRTNNNDSRIYYVKKGISRFGNVVHFHGSYISTKSNKKSVLTGNITAKIWTIDKEDIKYLSRFTDPGRKYFISVGHISHLQGHPRGCLWTSPHPGPFAFFNYSKQDPSTSLKPKHCGRLLGFRQ